MDNERIIFETIPGQAYIDAKLVQQQESDNIIDALKYLPDFMHDSEVLKDAAMILNSILLGSEQAKKEYVAAKSAKIAEGWNESDFPEFYWDPINEIHKAYFDSLYKASNYNALSYEAKVEFIKEKGFDYLLNLLFHMYDSNYKNDVDNGKTDLTYEEYVRSKSEVSLTKLTMLFNLLYMLKGKTVGLELALSLCGISNFIYMTWDVISHYKGDLFVEKLDPLTYTVEYRIKSASSDEQYAVEKTETVTMPTTVLNPILLLPIEGIDKGDCWKVRYGDSVEGLGEAFYVFNGVAWHETLDEHEFEEQRQPFTAQLSLPPADADLQAKVSEFARNYMLPYIDLKIKLYEEGGTVWALPTGSSALKNSVNVWDYYLNSVEYIKGLEHYVSEETWHYGIKKLGSNLQIGAPAFDDRGFQGTVDLAKSFVETPDGVKHYLYTDQQTIPDIITGTARDRYTPWNTIDAFEGTFIAGPLIKGCVNVDIVTGDQRNPDYHLENDSIVYEDGDIIAKIICGNGFVYGHKVTTSNKYAYGLPWTQPVLTENGVMGGDSFAVTSRSIKTDSATGIDISRIPADARYFDGSYYKVYTKTITWHNAKLECENRGGHLATITSQAQQDFIDSITGHASGYWLGGFEEDVEGSWRWITDEPWDYTNWDEGEPNDSHETGEDYLITWSNGRWNDLDTDNTGESCGYLCEWDNIDSSEWGTVSTWQAFDGTNNYGSKSFHTKWHEFEGYIDIYNPNPINVTNIQIQNQNDVMVDGRASRSGTIYGSNDGENWAQITTYTNTHGNAAEVWNIDLSNNRGYFKYYRIESDGIIGLPVTDNTLYVLDTSDSTQFYVKCNTKLSGHFLQCEGEGSSFCTTSSVNLGSYNTWEIGTKFIFNGRSADDRGAIFGFWSESDYKSISLCYDFKTSHASRLRPYISTTGTSFNIVPLDWTTNYTPTVSAPIEGHLYNVAMGYDGYEFYIMYSEGDNVLEKVWSYPCSDNIFANDLAKIVIGDSYSGGNIAATSVRDHSIKAIWYLDNTYIKANNQIIWQPQVNAAGDNYYIQNDELVVTQQTGEASYWTIGEINLEAVQATIAAEDTETVIYGVEWHQPIPTGAGIMGGDTFAVRSNVPQWRSPETEAWKAFDLSDTTDSVYNRTCATFHSAGNCTSGWIDFYNPNPLNVKKLIITNQLDGSPGRASASGTIYGSEDGENWEPLVAYTNTNGSVGGVWEINLSHNENYYKYYRLESNDIVGGRDRLWTCKSIEIVATQSIVLSTNEEYQYDQDWTQPKLYENGVIGANSFAVATNLECENGFDLYNAFDGVTSTWNGKSFLSKYGKTTGYIDIYNPNPLKVTNIHIVNQQGYDSDSTNVSGITVNNAEELIANAFAYDGVDTFSEANTLEEQHIINRPLFYLFNIDTFGSNDETYAGTGTYPNGTTVGYTRQYDWRGDLIRIRLNTVSGEELLTYTFQHEERGNDEFIYLKSVRYDHYDGPITITHYNPDRTVASNSEYWNEEQLQANEPYWSRDYTYSINSSGNPVQRRVEHFTTSELAYEDRVVTTVKTNTYTSFVDDEYQNDYTNVTGATQYRASTSGNIYGSNNGTVWSLIKSYTNDVVGVGYAWDIDLSDNNAYYKYYRLESTQNAYEKSYVPYSQHWAINEITISATQAKLIEKTTETHTEFDIDSAPTLGDLIVYGGRVTTVNCTNTAGNITFTTDTPYVRTHTGTEVHNLIFSDVFVNPDKYTGINDIGILGANKYFIYNGMLFLNQESDYIQVGVSDNWTDIGASHATSNIYYTPGICDGVLLGVKEDSIRYFYNHDYAEFANGLWTQVTGYINEVFNAYAINNNRLFKLFLEDGTLYYKLIDTRQNWTYVSGISYEDTYAAFGVCDGKLYTITSEDEIEEVKLTETLTIDDATKAQLIDEHTFAFQTHLQAQFISNIVYNSEAEEERKLVSFDFEGNTIVFDYDDYENTVETIRGVTTYITNGVSLAYRNDVLQNAEITTATYNAKIGFRNGAVTSYHFQESENVSGWTDIISRYHHLNDEFYSYGICNGVLYYINNNKAGRVDCGDKPLGWEQVCGYYNEASPRTWGYALNNGILYSLQKDRAVVRDSSKRWQKICGSAFNTVTFIMGLTTDGYVYKFNASKMQLLDERQGWVDIFGRYSTMAETTYDAFGYGIYNDGKGNKLISFGKNETATIAGFWRENGVGRKVQLSDYNITDMDLRLGVNNHVIGEDAIRCGYPHTANDRLSNYDIKVTYTTVGFDNNTRYNVKTELQGNEFRYLYPDYKPCLDLSHTNGFNSKTGGFEEYTHLYATKIGNQNINGKGEAYEFKHNQSCLQLPIKTETHVEEDDSGFYQVTNDLIPKEICISFGCLHVPGDTALYPIVVDKTGATGLYYGLYNEVYGTYLKTSSGYKLIERIAEDNNIQRKIRFIKNGDKYDVICTTNGINYNFASGSEYVNYPYYIGGYPNNYGDAIIFLTDSYIEYETKQYLFTTGEYISFTSDFRDLSVRVETDTNQENRKVLDVYTGDDYLFELYQNKIYSHLDTNVLSGNLTATTNYNVDKIRTARQEGETYTTLTYSGAYTLDPAKAIANGNILVNSRYDIDAIAHAFNENDNLSININQINKDYLDLTLLDCSNAEPVHVHRYDSFEVISRTEEHHNQLIYDIITLENKEVALFRTSFTSEDDDDLITLLENGIKFYVKGYDIKLELGNLIFTPLSEEDTVALKELMNSYNVIDKDYIKTYDYINYTPQILISTELEDVYINKPLLKSTIEVNYVGNVDYNTIQSGDIFELCTDTAGTVTRTLQYNSEGFEIDGDKLKLNTDTDYDKITAILSYIPPNSSLKFDKANSQTDQSHSIVETDLSPRLVLNCTPPDSEPQELAKFDGIETAFTITGSGKKYAKFHIRKEAQGIDTTKLIQSTNLSTEEKDKLQFRDGVSFHYNKFNYLTTRNIQDWYGLTVKLTNSEDVYIEQCIFECGDKSLFIKEGKLIYKDGDTYTPVLSISTGQEYQLGLLNLEYPEPEPEPDEPDEPIDPDEPIEPDEPGEDDGEDNEEPGEDDGSVITDGGIVNDEDDEEYDEEDEDEDDEDEVIHKKLTTARFYYSENGEQWTALTDLFTPDEVVIGYGQTSTDKLPFNGLIDLTTSYSYDENNVATQLYKFKQITTLMYSSNNTSWTTSTSITTNYTVDTILFPGTFSGSLDCYESRLLKSYDLYWTENNISIENVIKKELLEKDDSYNPNNHDQEYNIEAYGVQLLGQPSRWDKVIITYNTVDHSAYLQSGTNYKLKLDVINDADSGRYEVSAVGEPNINDNIISSFSTNDYFVYDINNKDYLVVCVQPTSNDVQGVIGYEGEHTQSIFIDNGYWKYYDGYNAYNLDLEVDLTKEIYFKLYTESNYLEYSYDNVNWIKLNTQCAFTAYDKIVLGVSDTTSGITAFTGTIDLSKCYGVLDNSSTYLYKSYKKIIPYVSTDETNWIPLVISPLLTANDFITFGKKYNGQLNLYKSNLLTPNCTYWTANKINVYSKIDYLEDNTQSGEFVYSVIRDEMPLLSQVGNSGSEEPEYSDIIIDGSLTWTKLQKGEDVVLTDTQMSFVRGSFVDISAFTQIKKLTTLKGEYVVVMVKLNDKNHTPQAKLFNFATNTVTPIHNWKANTLFDMYDIMTDNLDYYQVSAIEDSQYYQENETIKVDPLELETTITGFPHVGNQVRLVYNDWYLFGNVKSEYDFRVEYEGNKCYISCQKYNPDYDPNDEFSTIEPYYKHVLYITDRKNIKVNIGYEFDGAVLVRDSYYGDLVLCDYENWLFYSILYKKYNESEWSVWREFAVQDTWEIRMATGYDLLGKMYLLSSYVSTDVYTTAFVVYYNGEYIEPVGNVLFDDWGNAYNFRDDWYLRLRNKAIAIGNKIHIFMKTSDDVKEQGMATGVNIQGGNVVESAFPSNILHRAVPNRTVCVVYEFNSDFTVSFKVIGYYATSFTRMKEPYHTLTIIPVKVIHTGRYIMSLGHKQEVLEYEYLTDDEIGNKLKVQYRIMKTNKEYDYFTEIATNDLQWYDMSTKKGDLTYYKEDINQVYYGYVLTGYYYDYRGNTINVDPNGVEYYRGDKIEYRVIIGDLEDPIDIRVNNIILYEDKMIKQGIQF